MDHKISFKVDNNDFDDFVDDNGNDDDDFWILWSVIGWSGFSRIYP